MVGTRRLVHVYREESRVKRLLSAELNFVRRLPKRNILWTQN